jgi:hypothetical protein
VAVRTARHKYIVRPGGQSELYDCVADPGLTDNLIGDPGSDAIRGALTEKLLAWHIHTTAAPPLDKDARALPPCLRTPSFGAAPADFLDIPG